VNVVSFGVTVPAGQVQLVRIVGEATVFDPRPGSADGPQGCTGGRQTAPVATRNGPTEGQNFNVLIDGVAPDFNGYQKVSLELRLSAGDHTVTWTFNPTYCPNGDADPNRKVRISDAYLAVLTDASFP
jgi:hypothetical protein